MQDYTSHIVPAVLFGMARELNQTGFRNWSLYPNRNLIIFVFVFV